MDEIRGLLSEQLSGDGRFQVEVISTASALIGRCRPNPARRSARRPLDRWHRNI
ncbi:hypothetical protein ACVBEQ_22330 [Nakamurella sp. GG22]